MAQTSFTSTSMGLVIVVKPSRYHYASDGQRYFVEGKHARFVNGKFDTDDQEIIDFLMNHRDYGILFNCVNPGVTVDVEEVAEKKQRRHAQERSLARKTEAKATNKTQIEQPEGAPAGEPVPGTPAD